MSCAISSKRKRDPTFQPSEKNNLISIVAKHYNIIECKKTDALSTRSKNEKWVKIAEEFNAISTIMQREWQVLKNLWENLKKKAKSVMTQQKQSIFATGGGPPKKFKEDPILERVIGLIRPNAQGYDNAYDDDALVSVCNKDDNNDNNDNNDSNNSNDDDSFEEAENLNQNTLNQNWSTYTPSMLRTPRNSVLRESQDLDIANAVIEFVADSNDNLKGSQIPSSSVTNLTETINVTTDREAVTASQSESIGNIRFGQIKKIKQPYTFQPHTVHSKASTPSSTKKSTKYPTNRRRPVLKQSEEDLLVQTKVKTLISSNEQAAQEHEESLKILLLREKQEQEKLKQAIEKTKQEKLRTEILGEELRRLRE